MPATPGVPAPMSLKGNFGLPNPNTGQWTQRGRTLS